MQKKVQIILQIVRESLGKLLWYKKTQFFAKKKTETEDRDPTSLCRLPIFKYILLKG